MKNKVSVVCAFRLMQSVYAPLVKFTKDMQDNGYAEYVVLVDKYVNIALTQSANKNIDWFVNSDFSFTINKVSKEIVHLNDVYSKKFGDNFYLALTHIFECVKRDMYK